MASLSLRAYSLGLCAFMLVKVLAPGFYARQDMRTPVRIGIWAMVANMGMNLLFVLPLVYFFNIGHVGLALATSGSAFLNAGLLWRGLRREGIYRFDPCWRRYLLRLSCACAAMGALLVLLTPGPEQWLGWGWELRSWRLLLLCLSGGGVLRVGAVDLRYALRGICARRGRPAMPAAHRLVPGVSDILRGRIFDSATPS
jgi:putative peptidoglycan lipid II flippase